MSVPDGFNGRCLVEFMPCGCWSAVQLSMTDLAEQAPRAARFMREAARDKADRVVEMEFTEWQQLRNGQNSDLTHGCDHEPQWGGVDSDYDECPACWKTVKKRKDGGLYAHKDGWRTCSQEPWPARSAS